MLEKVTEVVTGGERKDGFYAGDCLAPEVVVLLGIRVFATLLLSNVLQLLLAHARLLSFDRLPTFKD